MLATILNIGFWGYFLLAAIVVLWVVMVWISTGDIRSRYKPRHGGRKGRR